MPNLETTFRSPTEIKPYPWVGLVCFATAAMVMVVASVYFAFYDLFSTFKFHDDEGYMLMFVRFFLDGHIIYDEIPTAYGPFYLLYKWLLHAVLSVPLTNDAIRIITLSQWVLLATTCGLVVFRATGSRWGALLGYGAVFYSMQAFHNEPGHPQEIIALLGALIPLIAWKSGRAPGLLGWFVVGALGGFIFMMKVNIGAFCLAAVGIALLGDVRHFKGIKLLYTALVVGSMAFPFFLMRSLLAQPAFLHMAMYAAGTIGGATIVVLGWRVNRGLRWSSFTAFLAGVAIALAVSFFFMELHGMPIDGLVHKVYGSARHHHPIFRAFQAVSSVQLLLTLIALLFAVVVTWLPVGRLRWHLIGSAKMAFVTIAFAVAFKILKLHPYAEIIYGDVVSWVAPWCWLCAVNAGSERVSTSRRLLAVLAAWHILLAYPVAGSQVSFGNFLVTVSAAVCAVDAIGWFAACLSKNSDIFRQRIAQFSEMALVSGVIVMMGFGVAEVKREYDIGQPLGLPGAQWLRLEPKKAGEYRELAAAVAEADVIFTTTGFNSLFFWTNAKMPTPLLLSHHLGRMTIENQKRIIAGLAEAHKPIVVIGKPFFGGKLPNNDLMVWILTHFEPYRTIGPWGLVRRKGQLIIKNDEREQANFEP